MKKIIQETKKETIVLKTVMVLLFLFIVFSCSLNKLKSQDYLILEAIFHGEIENITLSNNASNLFFKNYNDKVLDKLDSDQKDILDQFFKMETNTFFRNQLVEVKWEQREIDRNIKQNKIIVGNKKSNYLVSKPVFSLDKKKAVVLYRNKGAISLMLLSFKDNRWNIEKLIPIGLK